MTDIKDNQITRPGMAFNRWGPWMGIAFVVFIVVSSLTGNTPQANASGTNVIEYFTKHRDLTIVSICADLVGVVCGTFFFGYLYAWLRRRDRSWIPVVVVMGATIFMAAGLLAGGSELMLVDQARELNPEAAKALNVVAEDLWALVGSGGIGITALATALSLLSHRSASKWWAIGAMATGVIAIVGWFTPFGVLLEGLWILAFSVRLLLRTESIGRSGPATREQVPTYGDRSSEGGGGEVAAHTLASIFPMGTLRGRAMARTIRKSVGPVAAIGALATAAVGFTAGGAGAAVHTSTAAGKTAMPEFTAKISKKGVLSLTGPHTFRAGRVGLSLQSSLSENSESDASIEVASFEKGYTFADFKADLTTFVSSYGENGPSPAGIKALDHAVAHGTIYGGLISDAGQTETGSIVLPTAGTYYMWNDTDIPAQPTKLVVTGPEVVRAGPHVSATVTATSVKRFGGPTTLPNKGTLTFKNTATNSPHELDLIHVKTGTTRAQILASFNSNSEPAFIRPGEIQTDAVGPGHAVTLSYSLPKGEYVEACFFPDLQTGIPHAVMGMFSIVHVK